MKTITLSICLLLCTLLHAQDNQATLAQIEKANAAITSIQGTFAQTKKIAANGKEIHSDGTLYISDSDKMAMHYNAPSTDLLIINGERFYMIRGKKKNNFNTEKNKAMRSLRNTLLYCVHGKPTQLAEENNADISVSKEASGIIVSLTSQKKTARGYKKIVLSYDSKSHLLTRMEMIEWGGNSTVYEISDIRPDAKFSATVFDIPE